MTHPKHRLSVCQTLVESICHFQNKLWLDSRTKYFFTGINRLSYIILLPGGHNFQGVHYPITDQLAVGISRIALTLSPHSHLSPKPAVYEVSPSTLKKIMETGIR